MPSPRAPAFPVPASGGRGVTARDVGASGNAASSGAPDRTPTCWSSTSPGARSTVSWWRSVSPSGLTDRSTRPCCTARRPARAGRSASIRRSTTDQPVLDPADPQKRQQRRRPPRHDVDRVVPARSSALTSVDAEPLPAGGHGPSGARMRSGEAVSHLKGLAQDDRTRGRPVTGDPDLQVDELSRPMEIDPSVAARLRLYDHRARERGRHSGGPGPASTRLDSNLRH